MAQTHLVFWPAIALVALTTLVWVRLYFARIGEMRARRIHPQALANSRLAAEKLEDVTAADHFRNLFEVPVLFYFLCAALAITETVTALQLALGWIFVALRAAHALIHLTYNRVMHRFLVYVAGTVTVLAMWAIFAVDLARAHP
jgi:hypothetical protein